MREDNSAASEMGLDGVRGIGYPVLVCENLEDELNIHH